VSLPRPWRLRLSAGRPFSDVIRSVDQLRPNADLHYLVIRRELPPDRRISVLSADLVSAL
jgi:polysaccharide biosynthesis/export protein